MNNTTALQIIAPLANNSVPEDSEDCEALAYQLTLSGYYRLRN